MDIALPDAAYRLVSHSLSAQQSGFHRPETEEDKVKALGLQFPNVEPSLNAEAYAQAVRLQETAVKLADAERGPGDGSHGPSLTVGVLAEKCPGFSDESYQWAVNDGFMLTRK